MSISAKGHDFKCAMKVSSRVPTATRSTSGPSAVFTNGPGVAVEMLGPMAAGKTICREQNDRVRMVFIE